MDPQEKLRLFARMQRPTRTPLVAEAPTPRGDGGTGPVVLRLYDPIDSDGGYWGVSAKEFADVLDNLPEGTAQIELHINSPGGSAFDGLAILNTLRQHPATVTVIVDGLAASAASIIAMAGDEIVMAPGSQLMIHDASGMCYGQAGDMQQMADLLDKLSGNLANVYASRAGGTQDDWRAAMQDESWYTADEAVAAGLADRVLTDVPDEGEPTNKFDLSLFAYAGREHAPAPKSPCASAPGSATAGGSTKKEVGMADTLLDGLREQLGLTADADEATVLAKNKEALDALEALNETAPKPDGEIPPAALAEITRLSAQVTTLSQASAKREKDELFAAWLRDGKTSPAELKVGEKDGLEAMYDAAPAQTKSLVEARAVGSAVPVSLIGQNQDDEDIEDIVVLDQLALAAGLPKGALRG